MNGYLHSTESFGTVDGPGIRYVLFLQGCPLRCRYCHNPDTWKIGCGRTVTPDDILAEYRKNRAFYSHGGITATGGEPLMQIPFLTELFTKAKAEGIHTCIDTSGIVYDKTGETELDRLMDVTDLVMLDIKHIRPDAHKALTGRDNHAVLAFARYLEKKKIPLWIRHTLVPSLTDDERDLMTLGQFIGTLSNLQALDVLPYHTMGVSKYHELGISYPLEGMPSLPKSAAIEAKKHIINGIKEVRNVK
jgi:pyruvate formate lyase activating enzyme